MILEELNLLGTRLLENTVILGASGSGKTQLLLKLLEELKPYNVGLCLHTVKPDAAADYQSILPCHTFVIGKDKFNPLRYALRRFSSATVAELIQELDDMASRQSGAKEEGFWRVSRKEALTHALSVIEQSELDPTFEDLYRFLADVPTSPEQIGATVASWENNACRVHLVRAWKKCGDETKRKAILEANSFFTGRMPNIGPKASQAIIQHSCALLAPLFRDRMYLSTCQRSQDTIRPNMCLKGEIVTFADSALMGSGEKFFQTLFGRILCREALSTQPDERFTLRVIDELQELVTNNETQVMPIGRSLGFGQIFCVQSASTLMNAMADGIKAKHAVHTILGNAGNLIFLGNNDPETLELFQQIGGQEYRYMMGGGKGQEGKGFDPLKIGGRFSFNFHQQLSPRVLGNVLLKLRSGSSEHGRVVSGYIHQKGVRNPLRKFSVKLE